MALVIVTCVKVSAMVMALVCMGIQGKINVKYFLEGLRKDLYERRKCEWDVGNLNIRL